jgi:hypothetical protein
LPTFARQIAQVVDRHGLTPEVIEMLRETVTQYDRLTACEEWIERRTFDQRP